MCCRLTPVRSRGQPLGQLIHTVRKAFVADPGLTERASALLEKTALSDAEQRLLRALITLYGGRIVATSTSTGRQARC